MKSKVRSSLSWFLSVLLVLTMMPAMGLTASAMPSIPVVWSVTSSENYPVYGYDAGTGTGQGGTLTVTYDYGSEPSGTCTFVWYNPASSSTDTMDLEPVKTTSGVAAEGNVFTDSITVPAGLHAGANYFFCTATIGEDTIASSVATVTVAPKEATFSWTDTELVYNGEAQSPTATVSNLVGNDTCTVTLTSESSAENASESPYTATVLSLDNTNYSVPAEANDTNHKTQDYWISKRPAVITAKDQILPSDSDPVESTPYFVAAAGLVDRHYISSVTLEKGLSNSIVADRDTVVIKINDGDELSANDVDATSNYNITTENGKWTVASDDAFDLTVTVLDGNNMPVGNANVTLLQGSISYGTKPTNGEGECTFSNVEPGAYNLIAENGTRKITNSMTLGSQQQNTYNVTFFNNTADTVLDTSAAGNLSPTVFGLENLGYEATSGTYTLTVTGYTEANNETLTPEEQAEFATGRAAISQLPGANGTLEFVEATLTKTVGTTVTNVGASNNNILRMRFAYDTTRPNIGVFRYHDEDLTDNEPGTAIQMDEVTDPDSEGYYIGNQFVDIFSKDFSTFAIGFNITSSNNEPDPAPAGGGGGGRTSGGLTATTPEPAAPTTTEPVVTPEPVVTVPSTGTTATVFTDVKAGAYYAEAIKWAVSAGITNGKTATLFGPEDSCTRAQIVTFIWRAAGSPEPTVSSTAFTDIDPNAYYYKAVLWAVENRIAKGTSDTTFTPDRIVTRGEAMTFIYRAKGGALATAMSPFKDVDPDAFYADAVAWAAANGVTVGTSATTFSPNVDCNRGQIATFLYRANN